MKYVDQRRKKMRVANGGMGTIPSHNQAGLGLTRGASPNRWDAPPDRMSGSDRARGDSASGDANYGPTQTRRRYNITKG